ncbi:MAG: formyltransferase family protein [Deltaproteobacteria bacterium]|nr:formyltransferase family protein [Deltaproteobacteria bacterium]
MANLRKLIETNQGELRVVAMMSGSGTNLVKIIEHQERIRSEYNKYIYKVVSILTDNPSSNAGKIGKEYNIPVEINDIREFYRKKGLARKDLSVREEFDKISLSVIEKFKPDILVLAGYMSILTKVIINKYLTINVHPADLSIKDKDGRRKYTGAYAVRDAILAGEKYICSSTHIVEEAVDNGRLLLISEPVNVILPDEFNPDDKTSLKMAEELNQNRLKEKGDWKILPLTIEYLALGFFEEDENSVIHFKGRPVPDGFRIQT